MIKRTPANSGAELESYVLTNHGVISMWSVTNSAEWLRSVYKPGTPPTTVFNVALRSHTTMDISMDYKSIMITPIDLVVVTSSSHPP